MKQKLLFFIYLFVGLNFVIAQEIDKDLLLIKERLDSIQGFQAKMQLDVDISFINMPTKYADIYFEKGKAMQFESEDFIMVPKRGLDLSMQQLFKYPFITVNRGVEEVSGVQAKKINIIPTDKKADFAIATLWLDTSSKRIKKSEISTKKDGTFTVLMDYNDTEDILPKEVIISFEIEKIKLPIQYLAKNMEVDKKEMREMDVKSGKIILKINDYKIQ
ncbi:hypothetical protein JoomaDRAFT_2429 [Galbibacter orientalis DSM 19592]|uniref:Outer membrane lipoprotein-sorting protein n=1 Tax=Galbibacter orientalis DSM 19592 TaxID=926559 RepID=I3C715_9FLAO|nr:hypothetical protein [Galbibacter orientalis]EIJ39408.1 hypothetical protein JoomaDRAFT_2429 [Galbibacter orientalis DSM 19592]